jgi:hypothetical protein
MAGIIIGDAGTPIVTRRPPITSDAGAVTRRTCSGGGEW